MAECRILEKKNNRSSNVLVTLKSQSSAVAKPSGKGISTTHLSLQAMYLSQRTVQRCPLKFYEILVQPSHY